MAEMPERPSSAAFQNSATPMPIGEMIPSPVTTTRVAMLYEADGLWEKAVNIFSLIPSFLDVPMRLERLKSGRSSHQTEHDSTTGEPTTVTTAGVTLTERKKRRISYL